MDCDVYPF